MFLFFVFVSLGGPGGGFGHPGDAFTDNRNGGKPRLLVRQKNTHKEGLGFFLCSSRPRIFYALPGLALHRIHMILFARSAPFCSAPLLLDFFSSLV